MNKKIKVAGIAAMLIVLGMLVYSMVFPGQPFTLPLTSYNTGNGLYSMPSDTSSTASSGVGVSPGNPSGLSTITSQCTDPSYPVYCSNVGMCFVPGVVCSTVKSCGGSYYGCFSNSDKLICVHGDAYCFDHCIKEDTVAECGGGLWGCWIEGCDGQTGSVPFCYNGQYHCCPSEYPVYKPEYSRCWKAEWQCTEDSHCGSEYTCVNNQCEFKTCPACPDPLGWSDCIDGTQQRIVYKCGPETSYKCITQVEVQSCTVEEPETGPVCGNAVCETGENYVTCPEDCEVPSTPSDGDDSFMWWLVIILVVIIILMMVYFGFIKK